MTRGVHINEAYLRQLIAEYRGSEYPRLARKRMEAFRKYQPRLDVAIQAAVRKDHPHKRRLSKEALSEAKSNLLDAIKEIRSVKDFASLYSLVNDRIGGVDGIGRDGVTVYDIAHDIGSFLGKEPTVVYLHAWTLKGANYLGFKGVKSVKGETTITKEELGGAFSSLTCAEIEDFLCIYKDRLAGNFTVKLTSKCLLPI